MSYQIYDTDLHGISLAIFSVLGSSTPVTSLNFMDVDQFEAFIQLYNIKQLLYPLGKRKLIVADIALKSKEEIETLFNYFNNTKYKVIFIDHHTDIEIMNALMELKKKYNVNFNIEYGNPIEMVVTLASELDMREKNKTLWKIVHERNMKKWMSNEATAWTILGAINDNDFHVANKLCQDMNICPNTHMFWSLVWAARFVDYEIQRINDPEYAVEYLINKYTLINNDNRKENILAKGAEMYERRTTTQEYKDAMKIYKTLLDEGEIIKTETGIKIGLLYKKPINFIEVRKGKGQINKYVSIIQCELPKDERIHYVIAYTIGYNPSIDKYQTIVKAWGPEWFRNDLTDVGVRVLLKKTMDEYDVERNAYGHLGIIGSRIDISDTYKWNNDFEEYANSMMPKAEKIIKKLGEELKKKVIAKRIAPFS